MASGFEYRDASMSMRECVSEHNHILHGNRNMILHEMGKLAGIFRYSRVFDDRSYRSAEDKNTQTHARANTLTIYKGKGGEIKRNKGIRTRSNGISSKTHKNYENL